MTQQDMRKALAEPFPADAVGWKVQTVLKDQPRAARPSPTSTPGA